MLALVIMYPAGSLSSPTAKWLVAELSSLLCSFALHFIYIMLLLLILNQLYYLHFAYSITL